MAFGDILRTANFTGDDIADLIEGIGASTHPLNTTAWTPSYSGSGSMTYTSVTTHMAIYFRIGKIIFYHIQAVGTVGGTPSTGLIFTLPVTAASGLTTGINATMAASATDAGTQRAGFAFINSTTQIAVRKYDSSNYTAGSAALASSGWYPAV